MKHNLSKEGYLVKLRPVEISDAENILKIRSNKKLTRYLNSTSPILSDQIKYIENYFLKKGDYYFVIEDIFSSKFVGALAIYNFDHLNKSAEFGRWIIEPGNISATESAYLAYSLAFENFPIKYIYCRTVEENKSVISFHNSFGLEVHKIHKEYVTIDGKTFNSIEHQLTKDKWVEIKPKIENILRRFAND